MIFLKNKMKKTSKPFIALTAVTFFAAFFFVFSPYASPAGCSPPPQVQMVPRVSPSWPKIPGRLWSISAPSKPCHPMAGGCLSIFFADPRAARIRSVGFLKISSGISPAGNSSRAVLEPDLSWTKTATSSPIIM